MPIRITGMNSGLDTEALVSELVSAHRMKSQKYTKAQTKLSWKQDAWKALNTKISSFYSKVTNLKNTSTYQKKKATVSDSTKATVTAKAGAPIGSYSLEVEDMAKAGYLTGAELKGLTGSVTENTTMAMLGFSGSDSISITADGKSTNIEVNSNTTISDFVKSLKDAGVNASFDSTYNRIYISSKKTGAKNDFTLGGSEDALKALGLYVDENDDGSSGDANNKAVRIKGQDAAIVFNNVRYTSASNDFDINGISINALGKTNGEISVTVDNDSQAMYDTIKGLIKDYNELINEMTKLYNADSSKGYEPLTSEEKDAMTDTEVEEWEKKIKDSLLRRDESLNSAIEVMKSAMFGSYTVNGKSYSLSSFGISTLGILGAKDNEENAFHIDGDADDLDVATKTDKLMAMIKSDPDVVDSFFKQLTTKMYDGLKEKMASSTLSSYGMIYNDKQMAKEYSDYTSTIKKWDEKLEKLQDSYYKKFAAMESALATLQSQQSSLAGLFGGF